jgi:hypothetical protein
MLAEGRCGSTVESDGTIGIVRRDKTGATVVTDAHGRYQEASLRGNTYFACNSASQALSLNSTTATGLILTNPANSGKNLIILELCVALLTAPAGISSLILTGQLVQSASAVTHTTPLTVRNTLVGNSATGVGLADSAATIIGNTIARPVGGGPVATGSVTSAFIKDEIAGSLILGPGTHISLQCLTTAISVIASMTWEELSV